MTLATAEAAELSPPEDQVVWQGADMARLKGILDLNCIWYLVHGNSCWQEGQGHVQ